MTDAELPDARTVPLSRCLDWLAAGWRLFLVDPVRWAVIALLFIFILAAVGVVLLGPVHAQSAVTLAPAGSQGKARRRRLGGPPDKEVQRRHAGQQARALRVVSIKLRHCVALVAKGSHPCLPPAPCCEALWTQRDPPIEREQALHGWAITLVAFPVLGAGLISVADDAARGRPLRIDGLFDGLRRAPGKHITLGIFHLVGALIIAFVATVIGGSAALTGLLIGPLAAVGLAAGGIMLAVMVFMALWIGLLMALCFAPALVLFHRAEPIDALSCSAQACARNLPTVFVVALSIYVLVWIAMLPAGLGLLVLLPVLAGAQHAAWLDLFDQRPALPEPPAATD